MEFVTFLSWVYCKLEIELIFVISSFQSELCKKDCVYVLIELVNHNGAFNGSNYTKFYGYIKFFITKL